MLVHKIRVDNVQSEKKIEIANKSLLSKNFLPFQKTKKLIKSTSTVAGMCAQYNNAGTSDEKKKYVGSVNK